MIEIDHLTLRLDRLSEPDARRLARLIGEQLATVDRVGGPLALDHVRLELAARPGESIEAMASRIVEDLTRALARSSW